MTSSNCVHSFQCRMAESGEQTPSVQLSATAKCTLQDDSKRARAAENSRRYRQRKKNDEDYKEKERERKKIQRQNDKENETERQKELNRARQARYRERKRNQAENDGEDQPQTPKKRTTRAEHEKKKQYWRERKTIQRANMSSQKKRRIREYDRKRKEKQKDDQDEQKEHLNSSSKDIELQTSETHLSENAVRQKVFRTKKSLPKSPAKFAQIIGHIMKNASPRKKASLQSIGISSSSANELKQKNEFFCSIRNTVANLSRCKQQSSNLVKRCLAMSFKSLKKARSYKKLSRETGLNYRFLRKYTSKSMEAKSLMQRKQRSDAMTGSELCKDIQEHYESRASFVPDQKAVISKTLQPKKVLNEPVSKLYDEFKQKNPDAKVSKSKFHQLRPKHVETTHKHKLYQSKCEYCTNPMLKVKAINILCDRKGTAQCKIKDNCTLIDITLCKKGENSFHSKACILRECSECGVYKLMNHLEDLVRCSGDEVLTWHEWKNKRYERPGKAPSTKKVLESREGTVLSLIEDLEKDLKDLPKHVHVADWQKKAFNTLSKSPPKNSVVMHLDFSENYSTFYQEEVSSAHWVKNLVTVHPLVAFYNCPTCEGPTKPVMDVMVFLSDDNKHDHHAVQEFISTSFSFLKEERSLHFSKVYEFTDGCSSQYKSRGPFVDLSYGEVISVFRGNDITSDLVMEKDPRMEQVQLRKLPQEDLSSEIEPSSLMRNQCTVI